MGVGVAQGYQLTTFLYGLWAGKRNLPAQPAAAHRGAPRAWALGSEEGPVLLADQHVAHQMDATTCGSTAIALAMASDPTTQPSGEPADALRSFSTFAQRQREVKELTNARRGVFSWPDRLGTAPWGAARVMKFQGHDYFDRMVVDTSLPQSSRLLTHAAHCAERGYPVLLYVGGDTTMGWNKGVPRHVVVLHSPPQRPRDVLEENSTSGASELELDPKLVALAQQIHVKLNQVKAESFDPELMIFDPASGNNTRVRLGQLIDGKAPREACGGWPHIMWAVMPKP